MGEPRWTGPKDTVTAAAHQAGLRTALGALRCKPWCAGDGPKPAGWHVRCATCGWETDPTRNGLITGVDDAQNTGDDHRCEPHIQIQAPDNDAAG